MAISERPRAALPSQPRFVNRSVPMAWQRMLLSTTSTPLISKETQPRGRCGVGIGQCDRLRWPAARCWDGRGLPSSSVHAVHAARQPAGAGRHALGDGLRPIAVRRRQRLQPSRHVIPHVPVRQWMRVCQLRLPIPLHCAACGLDGGELRVNFWVKTQRARGEPSERARSGQGTGPGAIPSPGANFKPSRLASAADLGLCGLSRDRLELRRASC